MQKFDPASPPEAAGVKMPSFTSAIIADPSRVFLSEALSSIGPHLSSVESALRQQSEDLDPEVGTLVRHACSQGGKRLRPALVLLCAAATGGVRASHIDLSVALELIHSASLVHDDIMDCASLRRGLPTPNAIWGNRVAVKLGDLILTRALRIVAGLGNRSASELVTEAASSVCSGEIKQSRNTLNPEMTVADYYEVVSLKTASLFSASAEASALLSLSSQETSRGLAAFGRLIGLAYQIYDDCADLCSSPESMGKTLGTDLEKGTMTLPLILFIDKNSPTPRTAVLNWLCGPQSAPLEERVQKLRRSGVISDSASSGLKMLSEAESHLKCLPLGTASASLRMIVLHLRRLLEEIRASDQRSNSEPLPSG